LKQPDKRGQESKNMPNGPFSGITFFAYNQTSTCIRDHPPNGPNTRNFSSKTRGIEIIFVNLFYYLIYFYYYL